MAVLISVQYNGSLGPLTGGDVEKVLPVLRAKAVALFERTYRLSSSTSIVHHGWWWMRLTCLLESFQTNDAFLQEHHRLDMSLSSTASGLPPLSSLMFQDHYSPTDIALLTVHTLMNSAIIHLHRDFLERYQPSYQRCVSAARSITKAVRELSDTDYEFLNPILSVSNSHTPSQGTHELIYHASDRLVGDVLPKYTFKS